MHLPSITTVYRQRLTRHNEKGENNMKVQYEEIQLNLVMFAAQDVVTLSGFDGDDDNFAPSKVANNVNFE